ncbi:MAG: hypothetical protein AB9836_04745 [Aminipila sp.]
MYKHEKVKRMERVITVPSKNSHEYVCCLDIPLYKTIKKAVIKNLTDWGLFTEENLQNALCSKVCDLTETIKIKFTK